MLHKPPNLPKTLFAAVRKIPARYRGTHFPQSCTTIASYNIHKCIGTDGKFDPARIVSVIEQLDADLVALQEADERFGQRNGLLDLQSLKARANLQPVAIEPHKPSHGWHGNVILAREGVTQNVHRLNLPGLEPRGALIVDLILKGIPVRVIAAHLGLLRRSRTKQANALIQAALSAKCPTFLMGDLNEWRVNTRSSLLTLLPHFGPVYEVLPSFPSRFPVLALDRILSNPQDLISGIEVHDSALARVASDHLPIKARVNLLSTYSAAEAANGFG